MSTTRVSCQINAPVETVFEVISSPANYSTAVPHITNIEFLTEQKTGEGTKFKETRVIKNREATSTLEVTELTPNERIRLISNEGGTEWISDLTTVAKNDGCELVLNMEARPYRLMSKIMTPFIKGMISKAIEDDLNAIKAYCEKD